MHMEHKPVKPTDYTDYVFFYIKTFSIKKAFAFVTDNNLLALAVF